MSVTVNGVEPSRQITAGTGLTGGGTLAADRTLAADFGTAAGKVTQGNDSRLSDARTPTAHAATHSSAGSDPVTLAQSQITGLVAALAAIAGLVPTAVKTGAYSAAAADLVPVNAALANLVITLPTAPTDGTRILVKKVDSSTHTVTVNRGGSDVFNVAGGSTSIVLSYQFAGILVQYSSSASIWYVTAADAGTGIVAPSRQVLSGTGLTGGGDLSADRTLAVSYGTTAGTAAQGNDSRITGALQSGATAGGDLSGTLPNPTVAKVNGVSLAGLATGVVKNTTGTGAPSIAAAADIPTVAAGSTGPLSASDASTTNARTPTAHKTSHATGGSDVLTPSDIGAAPASNTVGGGYGMPAAAALSTNPTLAVALTNAAGNLGGDVALSTTATDIMSTASLAIGTWLVNFGCSLHSTAASGGTCELKVVVGGATATFAGQTSTMIRTVNGGDSGGSLACIVTVTVAGTIKFQGASQQVTSAKAATFVTSYTNATGYTAVRIA